ncbi:MAG: hypothetical protein ACPGSN_00005 [Psychrobium sp.]
MTDKLVEYIIELNESPEALEKHNADPETAAAEFGLDESDLDLIRNQDVEEIKKRCEASPTDTSGVMIGFFNQ